jgi:hypothetical protein
MVCVLLERETLVSVQIRVADFGDVNLTQQGNQPVMEPFAPPSHELK